MKRLIFLVAIIALLSGCGGGELPEAELPPVGEILNEPPEYVPIEPNTQEDFQEYTSTDTFSNDICTCHMSEMETLFRAFLKAYIEGDEETFKNYMSEDLYNEYLESLTLSPTDERWVYNGVTWLSAVIDDKWTGWFIWNPHNNTGLHEPGITFFTRLITQNDIDWDNDIGTKFLVNISYSENQEFSVNWFGLEQ
jgi:hypothetical protein